MDIVSHALWAGAAAEAVRRRRSLRSRIVWTAVGLGILPDIAAVFPMVVWAALQPDVLGLVAAYITATPHTEPAIPAIVETMSHHAHCVTHSAVVAAMVSLVVWRKWPAIFPALVGWWLHIAIDIPTHSDDYYAVPFLYPLTYWGFDGVAWKTPWVMAVNLTGLALAYAALLIRRGRNRYQRRWPWKSS
jgi:hypothetical protein